MLIRMAVPSPSGLDQFVISRLFGFSCAPSSSSQFVLLSATPSASSSAVAFREARPGLGGLQRRKRSERVFERGRKLEKLTGGGAMPCGSSFLGHVLEFVCVANETSLERPATRRRRRLLRHGVSRSLAL